MLFRCRQTISATIIIAACSFINDLPADQKKVKEEGIKFGKMAHSKGKWFKDAINIDEITPPDQLGKQFDGKEARKRMREQNFPSNETDEIVNNPNNFRKDEYQPDDEAIANGDRIVEQFESGIVEQGIEDTYTFEKCLQPDAPFELEVRYSLGVKINRIPGQKQKVQVCRGHHKEIYCQGSRKHEIKKEKKRLEQDQTVRSYEVGKHEWPHYIYSVWYHHDDAKTCDHYDVHERNLTEDRIETEDIWTVENDENEKMAKTPNCTFVNSKRLDPGVRNIDGTEVSRGAWTRIDTYQCRYEPKKCPFLNSFRCSFHEKKCKEGSNDQCSLWELTFKCRSRKTEKVTIDSDSIFGTDQNLWETEYEPNTSFPDVMTKFQVFEEMKSEFEKSGQADIRRLQLFQGKKLKCSKSVAEDLMYDCCYSFEGLAKDLKLSKCTADEIALAEMREKSLCHYLGSRDKKFNNLWKSRTEHVFCCFPTKLSRVLQQEGRKQLGIDWGTAKHPNCRGLTQKEIQTLDFSKIDLSEAYDIKLSDDMNDKIRLIEERLKKRIQEIENKAVL